MAGLTYVVVSRKHLNDGQMLVVDATFDDSYPTGGEIVTPSALGLYAIEAVAVLNAPLATAGVVWDRTNGKLKIFTTSGTISGGSLDDLTGNLDDDTVTAGHVVDTATTLNDGTVTGSGDLTVAEADNASDQHLVVCTLLVIGF